METFDRYVARPVLRALVLCAAAAAFVFLIWMAEGPAGPGPNPESTLMQQVGIWGERLYLVGLLILPALVIGRRLHRPASR